MNAIRSLCGAFASGVALVALSSTALAEPIITEFLASNKTVLSDVDGSFSDWVEIYNPDAVPVDLAGWYLTDNASKKTKWQFPAVAIPAGGYLVVFADDKNRRDPAAELHASFSLSADGEYLGLIKPDGVTAVSAYSPKFPVQSSDVSYGVTQPTNSETAQIGYFRTPTPGARNGDGKSLTLLERVTLSRPSGLFSGEIALSMSGASAGQKIRYVFAAPGAAGGEVAEPTSASPIYSGAVHLGSSAVVRASVFSADDSCHGTPTTAQFVCMAASGGARIDEFGSQLPVVVLDDHGLGALPDDDVDRQAWMYVFGASGDDGVSFGSAPLLVSPIGLKLHGFTSRAFPKKSYNIELHDDLGRDHAQPLLGMPAAEDWTLIGPWGVDRSFIKNAFAYALSNHIGRWAPRTRFVEVFFNRDGNGVDLADYGGIYVLTDRIRADPQRIDMSLVDTCDVTEPAITGGYIVKIDTVDPDEFWWPVNERIHVAPDTALIVYRPKAVDLPDTHRTWIRGYLQSMEDALFADLADGWKQRRYLAYLDRPSWVDHHILNVVVGNQDALWRSAYFYKPRGGKLVAGPVWDFDRSLDDRTPVPGWSVWSQNEVVADVWNTGWFAVIARDPDFMQDWIDRWQQLRRCELNDEYLASLADSLAAQIGPGAAARDAAQWPDDASRFPGGYAGEISFLKNWVTNRANWIDQQWVAPPTATDDGSLITIIAPEGAQLAYTDGCGDPRASGGGLAEGAHLIDGPLTLASPARLVVRSYRVANVGAFPGSPWSSAVSLPTEARQAGGASATRLINLSSRGVVTGGGGALIAGVVVADAPRKKFLARAVGLGLRGFGVNDVVADPVLRIVDCAGVERARTDDWRAQPNANLIAQASAAVSAFPLDAKERNAAMIADLPAGAYTMLVSSASGQTGVALVELYELDCTGRAFNVSTRGLVRPGDGALIGGLVVDGVEPKQLLIRGIGPGLRQFGVTEALDDPVLTIYAGQNIVTFDDDWGVNTGRAQIVATSAAVGAFPLGAASKDAVLLVTLNPGLYTLQVSGKGAAEGVGLIEVYQMQ